jgi:hypothetical protein
VWGTAEGQVLELRLDHIRRQFFGYTDLPKWRDTAAHGKTTQIAENEAYTSIAMLLRFAAFADAEWSVLTS